MVFVIITFTASAQSSATLSQEKLAPFKNWIGEWQGEGAMQMGPGAPKKSLVTEKIEFKIDGTILMIEGIGREIEAGSGAKKIAHHALGILSYDATKQAYNFRSYIQDGRSTDASFNIITDNTYQWGFDIPNGKIRYNIVIDPAKKTWHETGEYSQDGVQWFKFFEMNLIKSE